MSLHEMIPNGKAKFYDVIYQASTLFPYSNDVLHVSAIGIVPFLMGKYSADFLGQYIPFLREHSIAIGFGCAATAEGIWQFGLEPRSPHDHPADWKSDARGTLETAVGATLAWLLTKGVER